MAAVELVWKAVHTDGTILTNSGDAPASYADIDHDNLERFELYDDTRETEGRLRAAYGDAVRKFEEYTLDGLKRVLSKENRRLTDTVRAATMKKIANFREDKRRLEGLAEAAMGAYNVALARRRQAGYLPVMSVVLRGDGGQADDGGRRLIYRRRSRLNITTGELVHFYIAGYRYADAAGGIHEVVSHIYGHGAVLQAGAPVDGGPPSYYGPEDGLNKPPGIPEQGGVAK